MLILLQDKPLSQGFFANTLLHDAGKFLTLSTLSSLGSLAGKYVTGQGLDVSAIEHKILGDTLTNTE
jgi:hypothetical protein